MENATKALLIAAAVLVAIIIISITLVIVNQGQEAVKGTDLSEMEASKFNALTPNCDGVFYQSYAFVMKNPSSDLLMWLPNLVVGKIEGENDGLLTPEAVKWGVFQGICRGSGRRGISHCDEIDLRRRSLSRKTGEQVNDILDVYRQIIYDLVKLGF